MQTTKESPDPWFDALVAFCVALLSDQQPVLSAYIDPRHHTRFFFRTLEHCLQVLEVDSNLRGLVAVPPPAVKLWPVSTVSTVPMVPTVPTVPAVPTVPTTVDTRHTPPTPPTPQCSPRSPPRCSSPTGMLWDRVCLSLADTGTDGTDGTDKTERTDP